MDQSVIYFYGYIENKKNYTHSIMETNYDIESPVECYKLRILASYSIVVFIASVVFNGFLLHLFYINKELRSTLNMLIITLTIFNFIGSIIEFPFIIVANFNCRFLKFLFFFSVEF